MVFSPGSLPALSFPCPSASSSCPLPMEVQDYNLKENNVTHVGVGVRRWSRAPENISSRSLVLIFQDFVLRTFLQNISSTYPQHQSSRFSSLRKETCRIVFIMVIVMGSLIHWHWKVWCVFKPRNHLHFLTVGFHS